MVSKQDYALNEKNVSADGGRKMMAGK